MISIGTVIFVIVVGCLALFWAAQTKMKEIVIRTAIKICQSHQVQFLDGTVHFQSCKLTRYGKKFGVLRRYQFDFYDGQARQQGYLITFDRNVINVNMNSKPSSAKQVNNVLPFNRKPSDKN